MALIVPPGKNKMLDAAWKAHKAAQRSEGKPVKAKAPAPAKKAPARKKGGRK